MFSEWSECSLKSWHPDSRQCIQAIQKPSLIEWYPLPEIPRFNKYHNSKPLFHALQFEIKIDFVDNFLVKLHINVPPTQHSTDHLSWNFITSNIRCFKILRFFIKDLRFEIIDTLSCGTAASFRTAVKMEWFEIKRICNQWNSMKSIGRQWNPIDSMESIGIQWNSMQCQTCCNWHASSFFIKWQPMKSNGIKFNGMANHLQQLSSQPPLQSLPRDASKHSGSPTWS